ncbi:MAG: hypothetical protein R3E67_04550 [Pseudomonadales bacterium]
MLSSAQGDLGSNALAGDVAIRRVDMALAAPCRLFLQKTSVTAHEAYVEVLRKKAGRSLWDA